MAASFSGVDEATAALELLERAGVTGDLSVGGSTTAQGAGTGSDADDDRSALSVRRSGLGALVGGIVGAVIGLIGAGLMTVATTADAETWLGAMVGTGLLLGVVSGACVGLGRGLALGHDWELVLHATEPGRVWVLVRAGDGMKVARAAEILGELAPGRVRWAPTGAAVRRPATG